MRIQKINGEISEIEKGIAGLKEQIQTATKLAGEKAVAMAKAGEITVPELKAFADQIAGFEQEIAAQETAIADKKKAIEAIKAEDEVKEAAAAPEAPAAPAPARFCSACGASLAGAGAFCPQCGAKQA
jgi:NADH pyrophosphatase NudC (nudix superfamily)